MTTSKFKVFAIDLTDGSRVFNVLGQVDGVQIVVGAVNEREALDTARVLNDAAWIEAEPELEDDDRHTLELSDRRMIVRRREVYGNTLFYPVNANAKMIAELAGAKTLTPAAIALTERLGFRLVATADEFPPKDIPAEPVDQPAPGSAAGPMAGGDYIWPPGGAK